VADQSGAPPPETQIMKQGELKAFVSSTGWCKEVVHSIVRAPTSEPFKGDRVSVQRMIGHLRIALSMECPQATTILLDGFGGNQHVYAGMAAQSNGWILEETTPPALADAAAECSALAAHPDDPERDTPGGVPDEDINADMAEEACFDAIAEYPDDPVYRFQVARAYWKSQHFSTAIEHLVMAAENDHGGALAYLGDAMLYGLGGLESDPEVAKQLYARAAEEGFEPAAALAAQIEADPKTEEEDTAAQIAQDALKASRRVAQETNSPASLGAQANPLPEAAKQVVKPMLEEEKTSVPPKENPQLAKATTTQSEIREAQTVNPNDKPLPKQGGEYSFPKLIEALANGNAQPEGVWPGRMLVYSFASITSVVDHCPELKPQGFDAKEGFLRAMNTKLTYTEKLSLTESYEKGDMAELQDGASQDGARLVEMKGCAAAETKTLVKTVATHYSTAG